MGSPSIQSKSRNELNIDNVTQQFTEENLHSLEVKYALDRSVCVYLM